MTTKNIFADTLNSVLRASEDIAHGVDQSRVTVEPPRDPAHGDIATNAAMVLAKDAGRKPRELAEAIAEKLRADALVAKVDVAGPGFINLTLKPAAWIAALRGAVQLGAQYGVSDIGGGVPVNVEYVSANPTGPMHVGHGRGAVFGDALRQSARLRRASRSRANITSTTPAHRSTCSRARPICATARRSARTSVRFPKAFIRAITSSRSAPHSPRNMATR